MTRKSDQNIKNTAFYISLLFETYCYFFEFLLFMKNSTYRMIRIYDAYASQEMS